MIEGYCYKIIFADGCWYWGTSQYKGTDPEKDGYYGSPKTHKKHWGVPHSKIVIKVFSNEGERLDYEEACILPDLNDPRCLNEHARRCFSRSTHEKARGIPRADKVREKISKAHKGRKLPPKHVEKLRKAKRPPRSPEAIAKGVESRKGYQHSDETRAKISESHKNKVIPQGQREKISNSVKGFKWYSNGEENVQARSHPGEGWVEGRVVGWETPRNSGMRWYHKDGERKMFREDPGDGWIPGMLRVKGKKYYNNGTDHVLAFECPGEGWVLGRLTKK